MAVAKSFVDFPIVKDIYEKNGRKYVDVKNPKTGTVRTVRWYSDSEYARMYPQSAPAANSNWSQKNVLGFINDFIYIFKIKPRTKLDEEYMKQSPMRFATLWGWYLPSDKTLPDDLPDNLLVAKLYWKDIADGDLVLDNPAKLRRGVATAMSLAKEKDYF